MAKENSAHLLVLESLTEALLRLMEQKPLAEISVTELTDMAGVGRVSFYRNYKSMDEILIRHLTHCTDEWYEEFSQRPQDEFFLNFWPELLGQYKKNERLLTLIYQNNASRIIKEHIFTCCEVGTEQDEYRAYLRAAFAGAIFGMVDEWIRRGMGAFPTQFHLRELLQIMEVR